MPPLQAGLLKSRSVILPALFCQAGFWWFHYVISILCRNSRDSQSSFDIANSWLKSLSWVTKRFSIDASEGWPQAARTMPLINAMVSSHVRLICMSLVF